MSSPVHKDWTVKSLRSLAIERFPDFKKSTRLRDDIVNFLRDKGVDLSIAVATTGAAAPNLPTMADMEAPVGFMEAVTVPGAVTRERLSTLRVVDLKKVAKECPGFDSKITSKEKLIDFILERSPLAGEALVIFTTLAATSTRSRRPATATTVAVDTTAMPSTFQELTECVEKKTMDIPRLRQIAISFGWKPEKGKRGKTAEYLEFLSTRYMPQPHMPQPHMPQPPMALPAAAAPVTTTGRLILTMEDLRSKKWSAKELMENARRMGWPYKKKGKMEELKTFLKERLNVATASATAPTAVTAAAATTALGAEEEAEAEAETEMTWPLHNIDEMTDMPVKKITDILKKFHITEALPESRKELLGLLKKKRCGKNDLMACDTNEVCDLRNELCRDDLHGKSTRLTEYIFQGRRFWGSPEIIEEIRKAVVLREKSATTASPPTAPSMTPGSATAPANVGVEPIRISNLLNNKEEYLKSISKALEKTFLIAAHSGVHTPHPHFQPQFRLFDDLHSERI